MSKANTVIGEGNSFASAEFHPGQNFPAVEHAGSAMDHQREFAQVCREIMTMTVFDPQLFSGFFPEHSWDLHRPDIFSHRMMSTRFRDQHAAAICKRINCRRPGSTDRKIRFLTGMPLT